MRDIVATIQPDQDDIVRAPLAESICVQGAPGTGKTAVGLHRAAWLLYAFRERLSRSGVLVVGFFDSDDDVAAFDHKVITAYRWPADEVTRRLAQAGFVAKGVSIALIGNPRAVMSKISIGHDVSGDGSQASNDFHS